MVDFGSKPKKTRLPPPPAAEEASQTLEAPEVAPAASVVDGRKPRNKTHRTVPFGTKVTAEFDERFRETAFRRKRKHAEMLEEMLELYRETHGIN